MSYDELIDWKSAYLFLSYLTEHIALGIHHSLVLDIYGNVWYMGRDFSSGELNIIPTKLNIPFKAISVAAGNEHSLVLLEDGTIYALGSNSDGQLGLPKNIISTAGIRLELNVKIKFIATGANHSILIDEDGDVYGMGNNFAHQLGLYNITHSEKIYSPLKISINAKIVAASCGSNYSLLLDEQGHVYAMGTNMYGKLGLGIRHAALTPEKLDLADKIISISAGRDHALLLSEKGLVYVMGNGLYGQLGNGNLKNQYIPQPIDINDNIISVAAGGYHSLILSEDGSVYVMGRNSHTQLGLIQTVQQVQNPIKLNISDKIISIACGEYHSMLLADTGFIYVMGNNNSRQLGSDYDPIIGRPVVIPQFRLFNV